MVINDQHLNYINNSVLIRFIRENRIKVPDCSYTKENMVATINAFVSNNPEKRADVEAALNIWITQGRKKIIYRYFEEDVNFEGTLEEKSRNIKVLFNLREEKELCKLSIPEGSRELYNIIIKADNNEIEEIKFIYVEKVYRKLKNGDFEEIALPTIVYVNLIEKEIYSKVAVKSDVYRDTSDFKKTEEVQIAKDLIEEVLKKLEIDTEIDDIQKSDLENILFAIHDEITELPKEIIDISDGINSELNEFVDIVVKSIEILDNQLVKEEMFQGVKKVILKNIISMYEDKKIYEKGKYAISNGIDGAGAAMTRFKFNAPARRPVQSTPEYQDIRNVMAGLDKIKKDVLFWKSTINTSDSIRMKMYAHNLGYIQVCFEQYVYEEDINNVLSKIREFKERR